MADIPVFIEPPAPVKKPTCKYYVSIDRPECGEVADFEVPTQAGTRMVPLCATHKAHHDRVQAQMRLRRQGKSA